MRRRPYERRPAPGAAWAPRLPGLAILLFVAAAFGHRLGYVESEALVFVAGLSLLLVLAGLTAAIVAFRGLWTRGDRGGRRIAGGLVLSAVALAPVAVALYWLATTPHLADVSTDTADPPEIGANPAAASWLSNPSRIITPAQALAISTAWPTITGRRYDAAFDSVVRVVEAQLALEGWEVTRPAPVGAVEATILAVANSFLLGFPSDVAIRITDEGETTYVDMRSASRYGAVDLGDNGRRVDAFLKDLDAAVAADVGTMGAGAPVAEPESAPMLPSPRPDPEG